MLPTVRATPMDISFSKLQKYHPLEEQEKYMVITIFRQVSKNCLKKLDNEYNFIKLSNFLKSFNFLI